MRNYLVGAGLLIAALVGAAFLTDSWPFAGREAPVAAKPSPDETFIGKGERAPREFVYLDNTRAEAYLSQLQAGNKKLLTISESHNAKVNAELGIGPVKAGGEAGSEDAAETSMSPTASSNFQAMISRLTKLALYKDLGTAPDAKESDTNAKASQTGCIPDVVPTGDSLFARNWCGVYESAIVTFVATLHKPLFVQAYLKLRWADANSRLHKAGKELLKLIGDQPRVPVATTKRGLRIIMPVQTALLSTEPTLFSPRLRVVAKVVRRIDHTPYDGLGFYARFDRLLWKRYAVVRKRLGINTARLRRELESYRAIKQPAALLLPVAIFN